MHTRIVTACFFVLSGVLAGGPVFIVDSTGFESPNFLTTFNGTGELAGQSGLPLPVGTWQQTPGSGTAVVQNSVFAPGGGTQSVQVDRAAGSDKRWAVPVTGHPGAGVSLINIDWDMRVQQTTSNVFGPFFGVEAYDNFGPRGLLGSFGVDATTGEILYQQTTTGFLVAPGPTVAFGAWNHFQLGLDFTQHMFTISLNGVAINTSTFVDQANIGGGLNHFSDADIATFAAGGDPTSLNLTGRAYFDNFAVTAVVPAPEPATFAFMAIGLAAIAGAVRKRSVGKR